MDPSSVGENSSLCGGSGLAPGQSCDGCQQAWRGSEPLARGSMTSHLYKRATVCEYFKSGFTSGHALQKTKSLMTSYYSSCIPPPSYRLQCFDGMPVWGYGSDDCRKLPTAPRGCILGRAEDGTTKDDLNLPTFGLTGEPTPEERTRSVTPPQPTHVTDPTSGLNIHVVL
eukprot:6463736-Amphidinium_carterae.1